VSEYASDIFKVMLLEEDNFTVKSADFLKTASGTQEISQRARACLLEWVVEVHQRFKLWPETLFVTVNMVDRFIEKYPLKKSEL
jgi:hypothetical protein